MALPNHIKEYVLELIDKKVKYSKIIEIIQKKGFSISKSGISYIKYNFSPDKAKDNNIYFFEYLDHGVSLRPLEEILKNPIKLWCTGKIVADSEDLIIVQGSGVKHREYTEGIPCEIIVKKAIISQIPISSG